MSKYSKIAHYQDFNELLGILEKSGNDYDMEKIEAAYRFAEESHGDQRRVSGIPYILHPTSVACIVAELGMDTDTICAITGGVAIAFFKEMSDSLVAEIERRLLSDMQEVCKRFAAFYQSKETN